MSSRFETTWFAPTTFWSPRLIRNTVGQTRRMEPLRRDDQRHVVRHDGVSIAVDLHNSEVVVKPVAHVDERWESLDLTLEHVGRDEVLLAGSLKGNHARVEGVHPVGGHVRPEAVAQVD